MAKNNEQVCFRTTIGGQALIEGILMRGPDKQAIVCRTAEGMTEKVEPLKLVKDRHPALGWPFIRGLVIFVDSMVKGMRALTYSASLLPEDEQEEPTKFDLWLEKKLGSEKAEKIVIGIAAVLGVLLAIIIKTFATGACSEDMLGSFICAGIGGAFMAQIFVNVGMNLRLLPVIGVTLPFYSAGGSSVLMLYICVGLVLSVYMHNTKKLFG